MWFGLGLLKIRRDILTASPPASPGRHEDGPEPGAQMGTTELVGIPGREPQPKLRPPELISVRWEPWAAVCGDEWGAAPQDGGEARGGGDRCSAVGGREGRVPARR